ncbi:lectin-like protein [Desulfovibrio gilichinskyi]|uniref:Lectin C-type domain-containing protein n=1 Tax=Desulfovibrio gilichinskyi TaxID=1519643 RepID=A0A1X7CD36_9BACT|nr:lectin-like protein [Desulfovibrio gilichinskyi]SME94506.1 Lectin C-type domain-containing protein [Desulfovibrio gilichinskyi]
MTKKFLLFAITLLLICFAVPAAASPFAFQGSTYELIKDKGISWDEANAKAIAAGGHLATITSSAENEFLKQTFFTKDKNAYWLGAFQTGDENKQTPTANWQWVTGEEWNFTNWSSKEPNNSGMNEIHLSADSRFEYKWNDEDSAVKQMITGYVIETPSGTSPTPIPGAIWLLGTSIAGLLGFKRKFNK